jgi:tRNA(Arg) A34 adenosine deaminase TadA
MTDTAPQPRFMLEALADARAALPRAEGGPFGACIVRGGEIIARAHNTVLANHDATCHAEINAIRAASRALGSHDLSGCTIYSTTEPCPMCFSAIHWARIDRIIFGTRIADVAALGFNEMSVSNQQLVSLGRSPVQVVGDFMREECLGLLKEWTAGSGQVY